MKYLEIDVYKGSEFGFPRTITTEEYKSIKNIKEWLLKLGYNELYLTEPTFYHSIKSGKE